MTITATQSPAIRWTLAALCALALLAASLAPAEAQSVRPPAGAVTNSTPEAGTDPRAFPAGDPADALARQGASSDSDLWRAVRGGDQFDTQKRGAMAGGLIQSEGSAWQEFRDGPLAVAGLWIMGGSIVALAVFYFTAGPIKMHGPLAGVKIPRLSAVERFSHWLMAGPFVVLAITGLVLLYGKPWIMPLIGKEAFASFMLYGKMVHNYLGFAFMLGLLMSFLVWVRVNLFGRVELLWLAKGGGAFLKKGEHLPVRKFNAGQKILFWLVMLGGLSVSLSGIMLIFPFEFAMFSKTFATLNMLGLPALGITLPTDLSPMAEQQLAQLWHSFVSIVLIAIVFGHIYLGTIGMHHSFDAIGSGYVDRNWAREHHSLWAEEVETDLAARRAETAMDRTAATPAE
ncbi:MAG: formate dehydrogenase subunit gamma [Rubrimonas sp.]|uniref:formate dehydrogenase subunit gamma n=1 Tax=Rubrimonas sp. TaxID=2036015 RepID=UPI002FDE7E32